MIALIPARKGSKRIPNKNMRPLAGTPLIGWTLKAAFDSEVFSGVYVSTDSKEIAEYAAGYFGAKVYMRPPHMAQDDSPDQEWVQQILGAIEYDHHKKGSICAPCSLGESHWLKTEFAILRPTSPFRDAPTIQRAKLQWDDVKGEDRDFLKGHTSDCAMWPGWPAGTVPPACTCGSHWNPKLGYDSMRAIRRATEPAWKQWRYAEDTKEIDPITSVAAKKHLHSRPTQSLEDCWIQTAGLEMAWCRVPLETATIAGDRIAGFVLEGAEALDLNTEEDWTLAEHYARERDVVNL